MALLLTTPGRGPDPRALRCFHRLMREIAPRCRTNLFPSSPLKKKGVIALWSRSAGVLGPSESSANSRQPPGRKERGRQCRRAICPPGRWRKFLLPT